jgi:hypothetical protein
VWSPVGGISNTGDRLEVTLPMRDRPLVWRVSRSYVRSAGIIVYGALSRVIKIPQNAFLSTSRPAVQVKPVDDSVIVGAMATALLAAGL